MAGTAAVLMVLSDKPGIAVILILSAAIFDFLDGSAARLLHVTSETGKQLDSLADIVSFGLVPATFIYKIMLAVLENLPDDSAWNSSFASTTILVSILMVPSFSAIRLARFNIQKEGKSDFFGLPTPAHALFWTGLYYDMMINGSIFGEIPGIWFMWVTMIIMAAMMLVPIPMLSLKFSNLKLRNNIYRYLVLGLGLLVLIILFVPGFSILILLYILLSLVSIVLT